MPYFVSDVNVLQLIDAFTLDHGVWGSDWPFLKAGGVDYASLLGAITRWLPDSGDVRPVPAANPAGHFGFRLPYTAAAA